MVFEIIGIITVISLGAIVLSEFVMIILSYLVNRVDGQVQFYVAYAEYLKRKGDKNDE